MLKLYIKINELKFYFNKYVFISLITFKLITN